jgi:hypothetical protein
MTQQVRLSPQGLWHRRMKGNGHDHTACGIEIAGAYASRDLELDVDLCPICFTRRELDTGQMKKLKAEALERAEAEGYFDDEEATWIGKTVPDDKEH